MISITDDEFALIFSYVKQNFGVNLEKKRTLIEGRLGFYIQNKGYDNYHDYFQDVLKDKTNHELGNLLSLLTTNHTFFLREEAHFRYFEDTILPWIVDTQKARDIRIWSAGCSTGQEPYNLSMELMDYTRGRPDIYDTVILATDISERALDTAKRGIYKAKDLENIPPEWMRRYFRPEDEESYRVTDSLRANVAYKYMNLMDEFDFKMPFHAIFCRNVMIYFDDATKESLVNKFTNFLMHGGFLIIGHSESLSVINHDLQYISPSIYRKI